MTIQNLIARLEKATGPDRALWDDVNDHAWKAHWIDTARHLINRVLIEQALPDGNLLIAVALTLVPEGCRWQLRNSEEPSLGFFASVWGNFGVTWTCHGATPATALCIAALRARATLEGR